MNTVRIAVVVDVYTGFALSAFVMGDDGSEYAAQQIALSSRTSAVRREDGLTTENGDDILPELEPFTDDEEDEDGTSGWGSIDGAMRRLLLLHGATSIQFW
jgi:hypothetical protein